MTDIDERVVQLKFDSSDFETKTKSTFKVLDSLHEKLSFKNVVNKENMNEIADNVQKIADKSYTIMDRMVDKIRDNIADKLLGFLRENTIGQFMSGWGKYESMTTSVATLKAQGFAMEEINDQLERLNYFTDETSYKFTDMVNEIGKFTAVGQSLEDSTKAMMGIANWAALSGKNANEASRAMYQLSQALGAGKMRLVDWKSIQNLNMDTMEFKKNAIEAALEIGTLRDNMNGTYTSLVGKKAGNVTFDLKNFADNLTEGEWFTSDVMMKAYSKYSEAVDEIRAIYLENDEEIPTAQIIKDVKEANAEALREFADQGIGTDDADKILKRWKQVQKVTDENVANYAEMNKLSKEQARSELEQRYADYLKEYSKIFKGSEANAEEALDKWSSYVSQFGMKAFNAAQEAKTFTEAIESAKDAASTVWLGIYQDIFGNYEEAKEIWTDLANTLYDIFVGRLWDIKGVFDYWRHGERDEDEALLKSYREEFEKLSKNRTTREEEKRYQELQKLIPELDTKLYHYKEKAEAEVQALKEEYESMASAADQGIAIDEARFKELPKLIQEIQDDINHGVYDTAYRDGRKILMQGIYAMGSSFKMFITDFRKAWDSAIANNSGGKALLEWSERFRTVTFRMYRFMTELKETDFYKNLAFGIKNLFTPLSALKKIIVGLISLFFPAKKSIKDLFVSASETFRRLTEKIVPSAETISKIARILRGVVAIIKLIGKAAIGVFKAFILPFLQTAWNILTTILGGIGDILAKIGDTFYEFEEGLTSLEAMEIVGKGLKNVLGWIWDAIKGIAGVLITVLTPILRIVYNIISAIVASLKGLFTGNGEGGFFENIITGFKDMGARAKEAWVSTGSFLAVINKYKGGKGLPNFLEMLGELFVTLGDKIWNTIAAIFGFDAAMGKSKLGDKIETLGDFFVQLGLILKWVWTNLIQPTITGIFQALSACLTEIGTAFKQGDILKIFDIIKKFFSTIGAMQLFQLYRVLTKLFGSGGLLRLLRDASKTLRSITGYFRAAAFEKRASAVMKLAVAFSILTGLLTALTFLPIDNLHRLGDLLMYAGIAIGAMAVAISIMGIVAQRTRIGLLSLAIAMTSIVMATMVFIQGAYILREMIENTFGKEAAKDVWSWIKAVMPVLGLITAVITIISLAAKFVGNKSIVQLSIALAGLGVACVTLTFGLKKIADFAKENIGEALLGIGLMMMLLISIGTAAAIVARAMSAGTLKKGSGIQMAIAIVALTLTTALVVMPLLEDMVQQSDKFDKYAQAILLFALTIISISGSLALMTAFTKGGLHMLMAAVTFRSIAGVIQNIILPILQSLEGIDITKYLGGIVALGGLLLAIGGAIRLIMTGLANVITAISKINWKSWAAIILSTAAGIALVIFMMQQFETFGQDLSLTTILAPLAIIAAISLAFGLFAKSLGRTLGFGKQTTKNVIAIFDRAILLFGMIAAGMTLFMLTIGEHFSQDNIGSTLALIWSFTGSVIVIIGAMSFVFAKLVKSLSQSIGLLAPGKFAQVKKMLNTMMIFMTLISIELIGFVAAIGVIFQDASYELSPLGMIGLIVTYTIAALAIFTLISNRFAKLVKTLSNTLKPLTAAQYKHVKQMIGLMIGFITIILTEITAITAITGLFYSNPLGALAPIAGITLAVIFMMNTISANFEEMTEAAKRLITAGVKDSILKQAVSLIKMFMITIASIVGILTLATVGVGLAYTNGYEWMSFVPIITIGLAVCLTMEAASKVFKQLATIVMNPVFTAAKLKQLMTIIIGLNATIVVIAAALTLGLMGISANRIGNNLANALIIVGSIAAVMIAMVPLLNTILNGIGYTWGNTQLGALAVVFGGISVMLIVMGGFISQLASLDDILTDITTAIMVMGSIGVFLLALNPLMSTILESTAILSISAKHQVLSMVVVFAGIAAMILASTPLISALGNLANVKWQTVLAALAGLGLLMLGIGKMISWNLTGYGSLETVLMNMLALFGTLAAVSIFAPTIFEAFSKFAGMEWDTIIKGLVATLAPFAAVVGLIVLIQKSGLGDGFLTASLKIAGGIAAIATALYLLGGALALIRSVFDPGSVGIADKMTTMGEEIDNGAAKGISNNTGVVKDAVEDDLVKKGIRKPYQKATGTNSPSKLFIKYGKFLDQGLAKGIDKYDKIAEKASEALAITTNEGFQDALGIASPSKVFYENGRFVVRGFLNGVKDEYSKNKDIGSAIGDGLGESLSGSISDAVSTGISSGLWNWSEEIDINKYLDNGLNINTDNFFDSVKSELFGEDTTETSTSLRWKNQAAEDEYRRLGSEITSYEQQIEKRKEEIKKEAVKKDVKYAKLQTEEEKKQYLKQLYANDSTIDKIEKSIETTKNKQEKLIETSADKTTNTVKSKTGGLIGDISSMLSSGFGDMFTNLNSDNGSIFGGLSDTFDKIKTNVKGFVTGEGAEDLPALISDIIPGIGSDAGKQIGEGITSYFTGQTNDPNSTLMTNLATAGTKIGDAIGQAISDAIYTPVATVLDWITGRGDKEKKLAQITTWTSKAIEEFGKVNDLTEQDKSLLESYVYLTVRNDKTDLRGTISYSSIYGLIQSIYNEGKYDTWTSEGYLDYYGRVQGFNKPTYEKTNKEIKENKDNIKEQDYSVYEDYLNDGVLLVDSTIDALLTLTGKLGNINNKNIKENIESLSSLEQLFGMQFDNSFEGAYGILKDRIGLKTGEDLLKLLFTGFKENLLITKDGRIALAEGITTDDIGNKYNDVWVTKKSKNKLKGKAIKGEEDHDIKEYEEHYKTAKNRVQVKAYEDKSLIKGVDVTDDKTISAIQEFTNSIIKSMEDAGIETSAKNIGKMVDWGIAEGILKNQDGVLTINKELYSRIIYDGMKKLDEHSPSRVAMQIMKYYMQGLGIGIDDNTKAVLDSMDTSTNLITGETMSSLYNMFDDLDSLDATPKVTPVWDDSQFRENTARMNASMQSINPRMNATVSSFSYQFKDYDSKFDALRDAVEDMSNRLYGVLLNNQNEGERGVKVTIYPRMDNLFDYFVEENIERNRRVPGSGLR